jgi:hypothetical protein
MKASYGEVAIAVFTSKLGRGFCGGFVSDMGFLKTSLME